MIDVFSTLKTLIKVDTTVIDNSVFRLHYKASVVFLLACSILVASKQYFGDPIDCIHSEPDLAKIFDTYCWVHPTFTLPHAYGKKVGKDIAHPGIDKYVEGQEKVHHSYYQWVSFILFIQATFFYVPRYLWKAWEGGKMTMLVMSMRSPIMKQDEKEAQVILLVSYLKNNLNHHSLYLARFVLCELLNLVNVVGQMFLVNKFLGGVFTTFGTDVIRYMNSEDQLVDPMVRVFPRMTKCTFHKFGHGGSVEMVDGLCILPLNIINEKIYIFLWFWFVVVTALTCLVVVYRLVIIFAPTVRYHVLHARAQLASGDSVKVITSRCGAGGWFLLSLLSKNMDPVHFRDVMMRLAEEMEYYPDNAETLNLKPRNAKNQFV